MLVSISKLKGIDYRSPYPRHWKRVAKGISWLLDLRDLFPIESAIIRALVLWIRFCITSNLQLDLKCYAESIFQSYEAFLVECFLIDFGKHFASFELRNISKHCKRTYILWFNHVICGISCPPPLFTEWLNRREGWISGWLKTRGGVRQLIPLMSTQSVWMKKETYWTRCLTFVHTCWTRSKISNGFWKRENECTISFAEVRSIFTDLQVWVAATSLRLLTLTFLALLIAWWAIFYYSATLICFFEAYTRW